MMISRYSLTWDEGKGTFPCQHMRAEAAYL